MNDSSCEQHPLLLEDLSEEEQFSSYQRRFRPMFRGRAKNKAKGAIAVLKLWPDHWSSTVTYWWIALGMIAIIILIVYNCIAALSLPTNHFRGIKIRSNSNVTDTYSSHSPKLQNVFMHLFFDNSKNIEFNSYVPYIESIANKYPDYNYKLVIITNDTNVESKIISAEENNEIAFNSLWDKQNIHETQKSNIIIEHITLTKYMENSPLGKYWRTLPRQFIEFLARAVSVWDKGGITFNPILLTPQSPHTVYIEKLQDILRNYPRISKNATNNQKNHPHKQNGVNNIRDIIDALERESAELSVKDHSLEEAESRNDIVVTKYEQNDMVHLHKNIFNSTMFVGSQENIRAQHKAANNTIDYMPVPTVKKREDPVAVAQKNHSSLTSNTKNNSLLPMFLDFLFQNKPLTSEAVHQNVKSIHLEEPKVVTRKRKHVLPPVSKRNKDLTGSTSEKREEQEPVIIFTNYSTNHNSDSGKETENFSQLMIDLKGNIIASVTPCHAFLGTIFSNVAHHNQESLTDFIIAELSIFCKGVLASCHGIDVILI